MSGACGRYLRHSPLILRPYLTLPRFNLRPYPRRAPPRWSRSIPNSSADDCTGRSVPLTPEVTPAIPTTPRACSMAELAFVLGLLAVRFECRCADCFSFRAVRCSRAVRSHIAIGAIKVCEFRGKFVTHCKFVGRKVPTGVGITAALHFQREGRRPREFVCRMLGHRFQQPDRASHLLRGRRPALGRAIDHIDLRFRLIRNTPMRLELQIPGIPGIADNPRHRCPGVPRVVWSLSQDL